MTVPDQGPSLQEEPSTAPAPDDLLEALQIADVWEVFCALPAGNRAEFDRWIGSSPDEAARRRRIDALVLALRLSPLMRAASKVE